MRPVIPPPAIGALLALGMWTWAWATPEMAFDLSFWRPLAFVFGAAGLAIDLTSVAAFFRRKTTVNPMTPEKTRRLVVDGFYRFSRNPMYLGMLLMLIGWALWLGHPFGFAGPALFIWLINEMQIKPEERALEEIFGEEYLAYKARVRRWI
ncbi:MAG: isoprenylcysteine carboxylmethyltransferase family protein [Pseudomonadota bacterium]